MLSFLPLAQADIYADCQALLVDRSLADQEEILAMVLQRYASKDARPAYFSISGHQVAIIPQAKFSTLADVINLSEDLQSVSEAWATKWGNVSIIHEIKLNNLGLWTGRFILADALGLFLLASKAEPNDLVLTASITTSVAAFAYLLSNFLDGPDVASTLCKYFQELDYLPGSITEKGLFVLQAPPSVIRSLKAFSHIKSNDVIYYKERSEQMKIPQPALYPAVPAPGANTETANEDSE
jgi:hypothetical protein